MIVLCIKCSALLKIILLKYWYCSLLLATSRFIILWTSRICVQCLKMLMDVKAGSYGTPPLARRLHCDSVLKVNAYKRTVKLSVDMYAVPVTELPRYSRPLHVTLQQQPKTNKTAMFKATCHLRNAKTLYRNSSSKRTRKNNKKLEA